MCFVELLHGKAAARSYSTGKPLCRLKEDWPSGEILASGKLKFVLEIPRSVQFIFKKHQQCLSFTGFPIGKIWALLNLVKH
jgi:hypothetical protein